MAMVPPQQVQLQCPNCRTPFTAVVWSMLDVGQEPQSALAEGAQVRVRRVVQRGKDASELVVELKLSAFKTIALRMPAGDADHLVNVLGVAAGQRRASFTLVVPFGARFLVSGAAFAGPPVRFRRDDHAGTSTAPLALRPAVPLRGPGPRPGARRRTQRA